MATKTAKTWQEELQDECRRHQYRDPVYNITSDRRGGRTAWSATVNINGQDIAARYWYDGQHVESAKEDVAEVACTRLRNPAITASGVRSQGSGLQPREEEKVEPKEEPLTQGATAMVGEGNLD